MCSAILNDEGYQTKLAISAEDATRCISRDAISLIVSSYPYALSLLRSKIVKDIPTIVLSDEFNYDLIELMKRIKNSVCLCKAPRF